MLSVLIELLMCKIVNIDQAQLIVHHICLASCKVDQAGRNSHAHPDIAVVGVSARMHKLQCPPHAFMHTSRRMRAHGIA